MLSENNTDESIKRQSACDQLVGFALLCWLARVGGANGPGKPIPPGRPERIEFEDTRHGTQTLIGNFDVPPGELVNPTVQATRTGQDFTVPLAETMAGDPQAPWVFVVDRLKIHLSLNS